MPEARISLARITLVYTKEIRKIVKVRTSMWDCLVHMALLGRCTCSPSALFAFFPLYVGNLTLDRDCASSGFGSAGEGSRHFYAFGMKVS